MHYRSIQINAVSIAVTIYQDLAGKGHNMPTSSHALEKPCITEYQPERRRGTFPESPVPVHARKPGPQHVALIDSQLMRHNACNRLASRTETEQNLKRLYGHVRVGACYALHPECLALPDSGSGWKSKSMEGVAGRLVYQAGPD